MKLTDLRGILQYIPQFREKIFILAIDAGIVVDDSLSTLLLDVALLRSLNIRVVLVHGAAERIRALADERQVVASDLEGAGVTDAASARSVMQAQPSTIKRPVVRWADGSVTVGFSEEQFAKALKA